MTLDINLIKKILESAVRAPSTHNSQPWLFKIKRNIVEIFFDSKYVLPFADKETRDLHISMGCMLENFILAATIEKLQSSISYGPFEEKTKLIEITLEKTNIEPDDLSQKLFQTISKRVNARGLFIKEKIQEDIIQNINFLNTDSEIIINAIQDREDIKKIADLTASAIKEAYNDVGFRKEMSHWMNSNLSNKKDGLPGYSLKMPLLISLVIPQLIKYFNIGKFLAKLNTKSITSAPLIIIISGKNDKNCWIRIGRLAEKIMLYAQSLGYQTSIYVGSIEIGNYYKEIQKITNSSERPQFILTVGHIPGKHKITPRHKIEDKMI